MKRLAAFRASGTLLLLAVLTLVLSGCGTTEADRENASARPWNSPKGWEHGFPSGLYEPR